MFSSFWSSVFYNIEFVNKEWQGAWTLLLQANFNNAVLPLLCFTESVQCTLTVRVKVHFKTDQLVCM